jgi:hypothetical protein
LRAVSVKQPAYLDQFQAECLDLVEHTEEGALVCESSAEHGLVSSHVRLECREGLEQRRS